ncbi:MAG: hypothetical protein ACQETV_05355, partial [Actinomycetota bacterium]
CDRLGLFADPPDVEHGGTLPLRPPAGHGRRRRWGANGALPPAIAACARLARGQTPTCCTIDAPWRAVHAPARAKPAAICSVVRRRRALARRRPATTALVDDLPCG